MTSLVAPVLDAPPLWRVGLPELVKMASPAAGAEFTYSVPGGFFERLIAVSVLFTPSATVASRTVYIEYRDDEDVRTAIAGAPVTVPASDVTSFFFSAYLGQPDWEVNSTVLVPLPPILLLPTHDWRIGVDAIDTTDTLTRIRVWRERFYATDQPPQDVPL